MTASAHRDHTVRAGTLPPGGEPVLDLITPTRTTGAAALVVGDPGTGKSTLLQAVVDRARSAGYLIVPAAPCPTHRQRTDAPGPAPDGVDEAPAAGAAEWLSRAARRQPVLAVVDDADRIGPTSTDGLRRLVETLPAQPVVFLMAARPAAARHLQWQGLQHHRLLPLDMPTAAQLLRRQPGPLTGIAAYEVLRRARGNPRALVELSHAFGSEDVPDTMRIRTRYARQLDALPAPTRRALLYAAGRAGQEPLATVLDAAGRRSVPAEVWEPAVAAGLVELVGDDVVFPDPLVAVAVYHGAPAVVRRRLHHDFAVAIEQPSFERAMHLAMLPLGEDAATAALLESESRKARTECRMTQAAVAAQRAAELSGDSEHAARRYVLATLAAAAAGDSAWTRALCAHVDRLTERPDLRCSAASATATALSRAGHQCEAMDLLVHTARTHPSVDRVTALGLAVCAAVVAAHSGLGPHRDAAAALLAAAADRPVLPSSTPYLDEADPALHQAWMAVSVDPRSAPDHRSLLPSRREQVGRTPVVDTLAMATIAEALDDSELAATLRSEVLDRPRTGNRTSVFPEAWPPMIRGLLSTGRWHAAEHTLDSADEVAAAQDLPVLRVHLAALRAILVALRGDAGTARALVEQAWPDLDLDSNRSAHSWLLRALGYSALVAGDFDTASRNFLAMIATDARSWPMPHDSTDALVLAIAAHRADTAADVLPTVDSVRRSCGPRPGIRTQLTLSHAYALLIDDAETERRFRFAVSDPRAGRWPVLLALARLHYGTWLRRQRRPGDARSQLSEALAAFTGLGAEPFAQSARVELRASGGDPDDTGKLTRGAVLSAQQHQIALLAAQGLRNREVADRLQLSPRTVSTHLHNVYLRLGINQRHQLRRMILPPDLPST
ncbi:LuxR C-terminal-related transcriptional regulator [Pseudonocardia xinjiangensis]|uniref:HTH luxR-type domain-containing protein n=1 Tax=Pseudonocardia xinjiangensis TaxID=75289 RepID=A0ABX1RGM5_9PSEU|nr:LuxR C-terminal-related transcriptional regulator [Pseudonocardia xinjiangensis]NMH79548.1 hypothetical protein [Pseudonocardia xinjiangensis]